LIGFVSSNGSIKGRINNKRSGVMFNGQEIQIAGMDNEFDNKYRFYFGSVGFPQLPKNWIFSIMTGTGYSQEVSGFKIIDDYSGMILTDELKQETITAIQASKKGWHVTITHTP
jgi:hypothetical protein